MATMIGLFAAVGDNIPIFREDKMVEATTEGVVNRFHYRGTTLFLLVSCLLVTCAEWISGTDSIIDCIHGESMPDAVVNMYCYISGTFSVPRAWVNDDIVMGQHVSQTGVGPYNPATDDVVFKNYYQWVPFMLFLQGVMFYVPHMIFKKVDGKKVKNIMGCLNIFVLNGEKRKEAEKELGNYFIETMGSHDLWSITVFIAHSLYLVNVVGQIFFTDCFLGYEFTTYGVSAASFLNDEPEDRRDAMARIFPRVTKCTFHKFGPSGTIQRHDIQCVLPINIINEKIYIFLWFWFILLTILTVIDLSFHLGLVTFRGVRWMILKRKLETAPTFKLKTMDIDLHLTSRSLSFGDWKLMYHIIRNMDAVTCAEWLEILTYQLRKTKEEQSLDTETLPLKSKIFNDM